MFKESIKQIKDDPIFSDLEPKRFNRQIGLLEKFMESNARGTLQAVTGFGKTMFGVLAIYLIRKLRERYKVDVVVPSEYLQKQWNNVLAKYNIKNVDVNIINSVIKFDKKQSDFLILDEVHRYAAPEFSKVFDVYDAPYILGLTGTLEREDKKEHIIKQHIPVIDSITFEEAEREGYISPSIEYNLAVEQTPAFNKQYKLITDAFNESFSLFDKNLYKVQQCIKSKEFLNNHLKSLNARSNFTWDQQALYYKALNTMKKLARRKALLNNYTLKISRALDIINKFDLKTITFCNDTATVDLLKNNLNGRAVAYHSKLSYKQRKESIDKYLNNDNTSVLCTAKALDEGFDLPNIEMAIVLAGTSSKIQNNQRKGRTVRFVEGKTARIINIYVKDTQDEIWLEKRQGKTKNVKWVNNVNEIV